MKENYFDTLKVRLFQAVDNVNRCADEKDCNRNHVNYGSATSIARVMVDFGHDVDLPVWDDGGFLRIPKIVIDGKVWIDYEKNQSKSE